MNVAEALARLSYFVSDIWRVAFGGSTGGEKQRKAKNGVDYKYHRMEGNGI